MTEENKRMLYYIKTQMKAGVTFPQIANNFGYFKEEEKQINTEKMADKEKLRKSEEIIQYCKGCINADNHTKCHCSSGYVYSAGFADGRNFGYGQGKPKWHDLRKNPDDLPKENGKYIIHIKLSEIRTITDTCDFFNGYFGQYIKPTAWCELPKFEE